MPKNLRRGQRVAADLVEDRRTGLQYYHVRLKISDAERERLAGTPAPGMPVETFIQTGQRTSCPISSAADDYLTRPSVLTRCPPFVNLSAARDGRICPCMDCAYVCINNRR